MRTVQCSCFIRNYKKTPFKGYMRMFDGQFKMQAKRIALESVVCCGAVFVESSSTCVTTEVWNCNMQMDKVSQSSFKRPNAYLNFGDGAIPQELKLLQKCS